MQTMRYIKHARGICQKRPTLAHVIDAIEKLLYMGIDFVSKSQMLMPWRWARNDDEYYQLSNLTKHIKITWAAQGIQ